MELEQAHVLQLLKAWQAETGKNSVVTLAPVPTTDVVGVCVHKWKIAVRGKVRERFAPPGPERKGGLILRLEEQTETRALPAKSPTDKAVTTIGPGGME